MYLGETSNEKIANFDILRRKAAKLGNVFGIIGGGGCMLLMLGLGANNDMVYFEKVALTMAGALYGLIYFFGGYIWYFGFVTVASWLRKANISAGNVATGAVTGMAIGYMLGGRRGAKASGITFLVILCITLSIGFYVGLFDYIKTYFEIRRLRNI